MHTRKRGKIIISVAIFLFACSTVHAADTLYFAGNIVISKKLSYSYLLRFTINPLNEVTGYSLTDAKGPNETKTKISGTYDSTNNTLTYEETSVLRSKVDLQKEDLNFVHATLKLKHNKFIETLAGNFTAMQPGKTLPTGSGEIKLINTDRVKRLIKKVDDFYARPEDRHPVHAGADTAADGFIKVFNNTARELPFTGNNIKFTIWDNGQVDGDRISVMLNGHYLLQNYTLDSVPKVIETVLPNNSIDTITVIALNEGTLPPNTGTIRIESKTEQYPIEVQAKLNEVRTIYLRRKK